MTVTRYEISDGPDGDPGDMHISKYGDYVTWDDYSSLLDENGELRQRLASTASDLHTMAYNLS